MCRPAVNIFFRQLDMDASIAELRHVVKKCAEFGKGKKYLGIVLIVPHCTLTTTDEVKQFKESHIGKSTMFLQEETLKTFDKCLNKVEHSEHVKKIFYMACKEDILHGDV